MNAAFPPSFETAQAQFAGAPPGFSSNMFYPADDFPAKVKSIRISPRAVTSIFFFINFPYLSVDSR